MRYTIDGNIRADWVPTIANIAAPTVAELNAGTELTPFLTKDGLETPGDTNNVDTASLAETFDAQVPGSYGGACSITAFRDNEDDDAWDLCVYGAEGYLVVRRGTPVATAWTAAQKVEVYPSQMHEPIPIPTASNQRDQFTCSLPVTAQPNKKATVAA